ncbi:antiviral reverse transcriptase Drt3b [Rhodobacter sp. 24-YEA-8]|uniref:antiviral reverse transcriptase Drt3b n=1 Tax=Rhodobacter sp. 24-YEA-8 TaxID=1884310 RepID=UPI0008953B27|nr:antiviral reverse transcriptase Drt3b [Rhodobacter sp. 24-YEA-8]SEB47730.1 Reverse transcriptase (RNA-dependent DNA polymerase) [Rhodobacter sp. 24-YEA-8]
MSNIDTRLRELRAILTETLPYELPLGFTNDNLFLSELKIDELPAQQRKFVDQLRHENSEFTKPFLYKINRSHRTRNTLAIIHPAHQLKIAKFIADFENSIVQSCARSTFSLRHPAATQKIYLKGSTTNIRKRWALGLPDQNFGEAIGTEYSPSFFAYKKYLLLNLFFSSNELVRLESRFSHLRTLDVSRCFFNIYTHSISWAQKDKSFSKRNANQYSFEQQFDTVMQKANYNETAGIVVGPEVSRIFAEILLQRVDLDLERRAALRGFASEKDYVIRRYVDDFHLFAKSVDTLNILEDLLADSLEEYKLFLNSEKREDLQRPFVTRISRVKHEVGEVCEVLERALGEDIKIDEQKPSITLEAQRSGRKALDALRFLGGSERQAFVNSFSEVFSAIDRIISRLGKLELGHEHMDLALEELFGRIKLTVRIIFYLISVDFRVPPIIRSAFLLRKIVSLVGVFPNSERLALKAHIAYELSQLLASNYDSKSAPLPLEILNTFLVGLMVDPVSFCEQESTQSLIENILEGRHEGYFSVICALHYMNSVSPTDLQHHDAAEENERREKFCKRISEFLSSADCDPKINAEDYLIFCDFLSCKSVDQTLRWETFSKKLGGTRLSKSSFEDLMLRLRHTNWQDQGSEFKLLIRRLQPVYYAS